MSTVYDLFRENADRLGETVAIRGLHAADLSYSGMMAQLDRIMTALAAWGIGRGDRVAIQLPNGPEALLALHGVGAVAVAVAIDPRSGSTESDYLLSFIEPKAIVLQQGVESSGRAYAAQHGLRVVELVPTPDEGAGTFTFADAPSSTAALPVLNGPEDIGYLLPTSGTTALPKLVPFSQLVMLTDILVPSARHRELFGVSVPLHLVNYVPLHLPFGLNVASSALASGGSVACVAGFDPQKFYDWLDQYRPTFIYGPPALFEQVLAFAPQYDALLAAYQPSYVFCASASLPEAVQAGLHRVFRAPVVKGYGMTELGRVSRLVLPVGAPANESAGEVVDPDNTRVIGDDGVFLSPGQAGELVVRSSRFTGYWRNPEANEAAFVDGWFRTGDMGYLSGDGQLFLTGRVKEVINSGGAKVSPLEVETVLLQHPQVREAAVFGLKNADVGEVVAAAVVGDVTERVLRKFAAERLPFYKVPARIILVDAIPKAASGKVQRNQLAGLLNLT